MGFVAKVNSTLGAAFLLSLAAYFSGRATHNPNLSNAAEPFVWIFGAVWGCFVLLSLLRNARSIF